MNPVTKADYFFLHPRISSLRRREHPTLQPRGVHGLEEFYAAAAVLQADVRYVGYNPTCGMLTSLFDEVKRSEAKGKYAANGLKDAIRA